MKKISELTTLEKCGVAFVGVAGLLILAVFSLIVSGFLEARSANRNAQDFIASFDSEICHENWEAAYGRLNDNLRAKISLVEFKKKIAPGFPVGSHFVNCNGKVWHSVKQSDKEWRFEFYQEISTDGGYTVTNELALLSTAGSWRVVAIDEDKPVR